METNTIKINVPTVTIKFNPDGQVEFCCVVPENHKGEIQAVVAEAMVNCIRKLMPLFENQLIPLQMARPDCEFIATVNLKQFVTRFNAN